MVEPLLIVKLGNVHCQHCGAFIGEVRLDASLADLAERQERARIRRELTAAFAECFSTLRDLNAEKVHAALDRICPEEG